MRLMYENDVNEYIIDKLTKDLIDDLNLEFLCEQLKYSKSSKLTPNKLMSYYSYDEKIIEMRQKVFDDIYNIESLYNVLNKAFPLITRLVELNSISRMNNKYDPLSIRKELSWYELYISLITILYKGYEQFKDNLTSRTLVNLFEHVSKLYKSNDFNVLIENYEKLKPFSLQPRAVTIGLNLSEVLQPESFYCLMLNSEYFLPPQLKIGKAGGEKKGKRGIGTFLYQSESNSDMTLANTKKLQRLTMLYKDNNFIKSLNSFNKRLNIPNELTGSEYVREHGKFLINISEDLELILGAVKYFKKIKDANMPVCKASISKNNKTMNLTNIYNPFLVGLIDGNIVKNNIEFDKDGNLLILVGANKGGKTTLLQAIGITLILHHLGFYVPCEYVEIALFDNILTHYQKEEDFSNREGRLGFESNLFKEIFDSITTNSFVLINEPFTTTSPKEGEMLTIEIIKAIKKLAINSILVTHYYSLTKKAESINQSIISKSKIKCLSMGVIDEGDEIERTYKLCNDIRNNSYAMDIVRQYSDDLFD